MDCWCKQFVIASTSFKKMICLPMWNKSVVIRQLKTCFNEMFLKIIESWNKIAWINIWRKNIWIKKDIFVYANFTNAYAYNYMLVDQRMSNINQTMCLVWKIQSLLKLTCSLFDAKKILKTNLHVINRLFDGNRNYI